MTTCDGLHSKATVKPLLADSNLILRVDESFKLILTFIPSLTLFYSTFFTLALLVPGPIKTYLFHTYLQSPKSAGLQDYHYHIIQLTTTYHPSPFKQSALEMVNVCTHHHTHLNSRTDANSYIQAAKLITQIVIVGTQIFGRAFVEAYKQAAASEFLQHLLHLHINHPNTNSNTHIPIQSDSAKGGAAATGKHALDAATRKTGMSIDEASNILNVEKVSSMEDIIKVRPFHIPPLASY